MKVSLKSPTLDLEIEDVKKLEDVIEFVREFKKIEANGPAPEEKASAGKKKG